MMIFSACLLGCDPIFLFGFDMDWSPRGKYVNNVYNGTPRYKQKGERKVPTENWQRQLGELFEVRAKNTFYQLGKSTLALDYITWEDFTELDCFRVGS